MTRVDQLPSQETSNKHILMRREAYKQIFEQRINDSEQFTLDQAKLLLNKFNRQQQLGENIAVKLGTLFFAALDLADRQGTVTFAGLRLQEIDRYLHRTKDPVEIKLLNIERGVLNKAIIAFSE